MVSTLNSTPLAVPRFCGCTMTLRSGNEARSVCQCGACCCATIAHTCSGAATCRARNKVSCIRALPPFREQNCFGTELPDASVVSAASRVPSPAASTTAQVEELRLIAATAAWAPDRRDATKSRAPRGSATRPGRAPIPTVSRRTATRYVASPLRSRDRGSRARIAAMGQLSCSRHSSHSAPTCPGRTRWSGMHHLPGRWGFGDLHHLATDDAIARALGDVDPCLRVGVCGHVTVTGIGCRRAIVLACFHNAGALLFAVVSSERRRGDCGTGEG